MKKVLVICGLIVLLFLVGCGVVMFFMAYGNAEDVIDGRWTYGYQKFPKECFVISYHWDGDTNNMEVQIPESYQGTKINTLGGYLGKGYPAPFHVAIPEDYYDTEFDFCTEDEELIRDSDYETLTFTIVLGNNISNIKGEIKDTYWGVENDAGEEDILYKIEYKFKVADENEKYYAEEGILHEK